MFTTNDTAFTEMNKLSIYIFIFVFHIVNITHQVYSKLEGIYFFINSPSKCLEVQERDRDRDHTGLEIYNTAYLPQETVIKCTKFC